VLITRVGVVAGRQSARISPARFDVISGTHAVCEVVRAELTPTWWTALLEPSLKVPGLSSLAWRESADAPLDELRGSEETTVDFDNDGKRAGLCQRLRSAEGRRLAHPQRGG